MHQAQIDSWIRKSRHVGTNAPQQGPKFSILRDFSETFQLGSQQSRIEPSAWQPEQERQQIGTYTSGQHILKPSLAASSSSISRDHHTGVENAAKTLESHDTKQLLSRQTVKATPMAPSNHYLSNAACKTKDIKVVHIHQNPPTVQKPGQGRAVAPASGNNARSEKSIATVSSLSLEQYISLQAALTGGSSECLVKRVSLVEEPFFKHGELKQILALNGLLCGSSMKRRELLDKAIGMRLMDPASLSKAAKEQPSALNPQPCLRMDMTAMGVSSLPAEDTEGAAAPGYTISCSQRVKDGHQQGAASASCQIQTADLEALGWMDPNKSTGDSSQRPVSNKFCFPRSRPLLNTGSFHHKATENLYVASVPKDQPTYDHPHSQSLTSATCCVDGLDDSTQPTAVHDKTFKVCSDEGALQPKAPCCLQGQSKSQASVLDLLTSGPAVCAEVEPHRTLKSLQMGPRHQTIMHPTIQRPRPPASLHLLQSAADIASEDPPSLEKQLETQHLQHSSDPSPSPNRYDESGLAELMQHVSHEAGSQLPSKASPVLLDVQQCSEHSQEHFADTSEHAVLAWLRTEVLRFQSEHEVMAVTPNPSDGQQEGGNSQSDCSLTAPVLVGRRVAFLLLEELRHVDVKGVEEVVPPGLHMGRVVQFEGSCCLPDSCEEACPNSCLHRFYFVRVMDVPVKSGKLELLLDLQPQHLQPSFESLLSVSPAQALSDDLGESLESVIRHRWLLLQPSTKHIGGCEEQAKEQCSLAGCQLGADVRGMKRKRAVKPAGSYRKMVQGS
ncbi:hypothetical protein CEUSTIGMA_g7994.t1 [Chlamydomonas eustigma]|uniref:Uncharacterized protein n=1 Tax=Chlamydomonas eustigma TaxID=1157962 RepID=A0A250XBU3_9CHLO|nr:hypothetical protein CEUSTIGMA_g7994.t1 [Chlamydomonas eustigma]|eukprot:GAX80557.1 hypothetical protein CEUSTIGMA_g7994.t1 [Chlamydomonas eustigma]